MQRYNLFESAHLALQDALFIGAQSLRQQSSLYAPTANGVPNLKAIVDAGIQLISIKEKSILPAIDIFEPAVADAVLHQHRQVKEWAQQLQPSLTQTVDTGLNVLYQKYMCAQLHCIIKTEEMLNPALWYYFTDKELQDIERPLQQFADGLMERQAA